MTLFPTYSFQTDPKITDADGNTVSRNAFDVTRSYINITGNLSHIIAYRMKHDAVEILHIWHPAQDR